MRHRLTTEVFDRGKGRNIPFDQKSRTSSTFTLGKNPHLTKYKLHSKSTYFYRWSSRLNYVIPSACTLALLVGGMIAINPVLNNAKKANAEGGPVAQTTTTPTVSLTLTSGEAYQQTTAEVGKIAYRNNIFQVGGSGITKYFVSLNTASGKTGELVGQNNPYATVGKVAANTTPANFSDNTWGYAISALNNANVDDASMIYNPVPSGMDSSNNSVEIARRSGIDRTSAVADNYKIAFAAKLGADLPSDHYEADVYLSVVASPQATISGISTMQEMDSNVCSASSEHETKQLTDTRDNKTYWIAKLKDGNCWMTQNLDYDDGGTSTSIPGWTSTNNTFRGYYDPGDYIYTYSGHGQVANNTCNKVTSITDPGCTSYFTAKNASSDLHYHVGNYYSWNAATNGTGGSITSGEASGSICPEGWKLPTSGNTDKGSFIYLLTQYGVQSSLTSGGYAIYNSPLYFVYGGNLYSGQLGHAGSGGNYWSSTPYSNAANAYTLGFANSVNPSNSYNRYSGFSVRCVAE